MTQTILPFSNKDTGNLGEQLVEHFLEGSQTPHVFPFDFLTTDRKRIETKQAKPIQHRGQTIWQFNIHRHNRLNLDFDWLIMILWSTSNGDIFIAASPKEINGKTVHISARQIERGEIPFKLWGKVDKTLKRLLEA